MTFFLIIAIASINIYFSLTMLVIDKKKDIATLHALGASKKVIRWVFLSVGMIIAFTGASLGLTLGLIISGLQQEYGFISMGMQSALMTAYPVIISISDVFLTVVCDYCYYPFGYDSTRYFSHKKSFPSILSSFNPFVK